MNGTCTPTSRMMPSRGHKLALAILVICLACSVIAKVIPEKQANLSALGTHEIEEQLQVYSYPTTITPPLVHLQA